MSTLRLAVTGLSRAGKTVFITSLVHNLLSAGHGGSTMTNLLAVRSRRLVAARMQPEEAQDLPVFPYRSNLAHMTAAEPHWPGHTETISRIDLAVRVRPETVWGRLNRGRLTIELIDYPGEWLLDLPLLNTSFAAWSKAVLESCREGPRERLAADWLRFLADHPAHLPAEQEVAKRGHLLYRDFLHACRDDAGLCFLQPARFVRPGDQPDAPLMWFCPLDLGGAKPKSGSLGELMEKRFEAYKEKVVAPFFEGNFRKFDRQIVLVDVLSALHGGWHAFKDVEAALDVVSRCFSYGSANWFTSWFRPSIEKVLFAATKADHVTAPQRDHLRELLRRMVLEPAGRARYEGATAEVLALASVVCTADDVETIDGRRVDVVLGKPIGEDRQVKVFPGAIPITPPERAFFGARFQGYPVFQPPRFPVLPTDGIPHIKLDSALEFLLGDQLA